MKKRTIFLSTIVGIGLVVAGVYGVRWWITAMNTVSTDDARVTASYATISAEVSGRIVKFPVDEGDVVKKGALLVQIDHENYKTALAESLAELNQASAQFAEERIQHKAMKATVRGEISRAEASVEAAKGILKEKERMVELSKLINKSQLDQVEAALKVTESNLTAGKWSSKMPWLSSSVLRHSSRTNSSQRKTLIMLKWPTITIWQPSKCEQMRCRWLRPI